MLSVDMLIVVAPSSRLTSAKMHERASLTNFIAETKSILQFSSWERVESLLNKKVHYILILL
jgi:hypothetical protein